jgi:hypothetical protein
MKYLRFTHGISYFISLLFLMQIATAEAAMRAFFLNGINSEPCYSSQYFKCSLGVRGDWLDITDKVSIVSGPTATITITDKGADNKNSEYGSLGSGIVPKVPPMNGGREGYVLLELKNISGPGTMRIKMERPAAFGRDSDFVSVSIKDGSFGLDPSQTVRSVTAGHTKTIEIFGYGLNGISVKPGFKSQPASTASNNSQRIQSVAGKVNSSVKDSVGQNLASAQSNMQLPPEVKILSRESGVLSEKMTVEFNLHNSTSSFDLNTKDIFTFSKGVPPMNADKGWPIIHVNRGCSLGSPGCSAGSGAASSNTSASNAGNTTVGNVSGGTRISNPVELNLLPNINTPTLFIRQINTGSPIVLDQAICGGLIKQQEKEVDVPTITWMVTNASDVDINQPFNVSLIKGNNANPPFHTVNVNSIPAHGMTTFNNWPGRPTKIKVKLMPDPRQPNNNDANQCLLTDTHPANTLLDPKPLIIRVDSNNQVNEGGREDDNDLTVNIN